MDRESRLGQFLRARRELVRPEDVGLPELGRRRVPGLRREELALLAGVSADYYVRLEQGRDRHPSQQVLDALARALGLDDAATAHLHHLARPVPRPRRASRREERVGPAVRRLLDSWADTPAFVLGRRQDVLAHNALSAALSSGFATGSNLVRFIFLDPAARALCADWERCALDVAGELRASVGTDLDDPQLTELVGELSLKSDEFRRLWARHDIRPKTAGTKRFVHPLVGELELDHESFALNAAPGQVLVVHHAAPGSAAQQALALLGSIAASDATAVAPDRVA